MNMSRVGQFFPSGFENEPVGPPPGSPPTSTYEGPWFTTQLTLSSCIGLFAFLLFCYCRKKWPLQFAPRTMLKDFSPHEAHAHQALFGWILPTIRTSEFTVLQIVGLDAAVLLSFFKMSFYLFSVCSIFAATILMPLNLKNSLGIGDGDDSDSFIPIAFNNTPTQSPSPSPGRDWLDLINDANSYLSIQLVFTYLFTLLTLSFIHRNYKKFIRSRQLFSLELVHSVPARTVMVTNLPPRLRGERALAEHFEGMGLSVESVSVCRDVDSLKPLLDKRTKALLQLEAAWVSYVGNPSTVESYDPSNYGAAPLIDVDSSGLESQHPSFVVPHRKRPTLRPGLFKGTVDAIQYFEKQFHDADEEVTKQRKGNFKATQSAFVTFETMSSAQIAMQTVHAPHPDECITRQAPEPRDIIWAHMTMTTTPKTRRLRELFVFGILCTLLLFWLFPIAALASLLSYEEIKKIMPWLARLIESNAKLQAIVQNSLPSVAMISLNALLPFILESLSYIQGYQARSWIEFSIMRKYFLFLLVNVVFIFLLASTYWQLLRDLADSPAKIPEKLALALNEGRARHFFISYVILQGFGIMPLQLLNAGVVIPNLILRLFVTRTPRDFAELNAPPMINYGVVYPQSILIFVITLLYSVSQPLIVIFGAIYFGTAYVVYKYKLLFVFYKPYESQGQAWPITFARLIWGVVIFLLFMIGIFILKKAYIISSLVIPLLIGTVVWSWYIYSSFRPLSKYVCLSSVCEVQRGEESAEVVRLRVGHPVTRSQSNLSRRRYAQNVDTLYVAPEDDRTDYSQPPMANWYSGVLNTGKRRYVHPALNGILPQPWLPLKKGQTLLNHEHANGNKPGADSEPAVVLMLRKRSVVPQTARQSTVDPRAGTSRDVQDNPWDDDADLSEAQPFNNRLSFDHASGVIMLPENANWLDESDSDEEYLKIPNAESGDGETNRALLTASPDVTTSSLLPTPSTSKLRYGTYYHHPEKRRQTIPGAFPTS